MIQENPAVLVSTWINNRHQLVEIDHIGGAHLVKNGLEGATLCGKITVHKRQFQAHASVKRCRRCIKVASDAAISDLNLRPATAKAR